MTPFFAYLIGLLCGCSLTLALIVGVGVRRTRWERRETMSIEEAVFTAAEGDM